VNYPPNLRGQVTATRALWTQSDRPDAGSEEKQDDTSEGIRWRDDPTVRMPFSWPVVPRRLAVGPCGGGTHVYRQAFTNGENAHERTHPSYGDRGLLCAGLAVQAQPRTAVAEIRGCTDATITGRAQLSEIPSQEGVKQVLVELTSGMTGSHAWKGS